jgi:hypothetical protein
VDQSGEPDDSLRKALLAGCDDFLGLEQTRGCASPAATTADDDGDAEPTNTHHLLSAVPLGDGVIDTGSGSQLQSASIIEEQQLQLAIQDPGGLVDARREIERLQGELDAEVSARRAAEEAKEAAELRVAELEQKLVDKERQLAARKEGELAVCRAGVLTGAGFGCSGDAPAATTAPGSGRGRVSGWGGR